MTIPMEDHPRQQARATLTGARAVIEREGAPSEIVTAEAGQDLHAAVVEHLTRAAYATDRPIELRTVGDRGDHRFLITPSGAVTCLDAPEPAPSRTGDDRAVPGRSEGGAVGGRRPEERDDNASPGG